MVVTPLSNDFTSESTFVPGLGRRSKPYIIAKTKGMGGFEKQDGLFRYGTDFEVTDSSDSDIEMAERVIQSCAPLKRDERMQLILEMLFKKRYLVYDTIVLRALRGILIDHSYNEDAVRSAAVEKPNYELEAAGTFTWFVSGIVHGLSWLMRKKSSAKYYKTELTLELTHQKCYHVFDALVIKTLKRIPLDTLFGYVAHREKEANVFRQEKEETPQAFH